MDLQDPTPDLLISAYTRGVFPMADARTGELVWLSPDPRAILPLDELRVSRSLARVVRSGRFEIRTDTAFELVMRACAESRPDRDETWIDDRLIRAYTASWSVVCMASRSGPRSAARACFTAPSSAAPTHPRCVWCDWSNGCARGRFSFSTFSS
jgi:hypothetical protein